MTIGQIDTQPALNPEQMKRSGAAKDFEALLIAQMMQSMRENGSGWLGSEDQASAAAFGLGEQELSRAVASKGGIGLFKLIDAGLRSQAETATRRADPSPNTAPALHR